MRDKSILIDSELGQDIIVERAQKLAYQEDQASTDDKIKYLEIILGADEVYGFTYHHLEEILQNKVLCPIPTQEAGVMGVINWRGRLISVMHLSKMLEVSSQPETDQAWVIVLNYLDDYIGFKVNTVVGYNEYEPEKLDKTGGYLLGIVDGKIGILNSEKLMKKCLNLQDNEAGDGNKST